MQRVDSADNIIYFDQATDQSLEAYSYAGSAFDQDNLYHGSI